MLQFNSLINLIGLELLPICFFCLVRHLLGSCLRAALANNSARANFIGKLSHRISISNSLSREMKMEQEIAFMIS